MIKLVVLIFLILCTSILLIISNNSMSIYNLDAFGRFPEEYLKTFLKIGDLGDLFKEIFI